MSYFVFKQSPGDSAGFEWLMKFLSETKVKPHSLITAFFLLLLFSACTFLLGFSPFFLRLWISGWNSLGVLADRIKPGASEGAGRSRTGRRSLAEWFLCKHSEQGLVVWTVGEAALLCFHVNKALKAKENAAKHHSLGDTPLIDGCVRYKHKHSLEREC